jgi:uncharacterized protein (DUF302 family)
MSKDVEAGHLIGHFSILNICSFSFGKDALQAARRTLILLPIRTQMFVAMPQTSLYAEVAV